MRGLFVMHVTSLCLPTFRVSVSSEPVTDVKRSVLCRRESLHDACLLLLGCSQMTAVLCSVGCRHASQSESLED